jgi:hypothetical protein
VNSGIGAYVAHPSHGLADPIADQAARAQKQAIEFNQKEQKRREQAAGARPELKVKVYDNHKDFEHDAKKMGKDGWMPQQEVGDKGKVSVTGTIGKTVFTGGLGLITGVSHKSGKLTVTWVKAPRGFVPREFVDVPEVPAPRMFQPEPYFAATLLAQVPPGREFDVPAARPAAEPRTEPVALPAANQPVDQAVMSPSESANASPAVDIVAKVRQLAILRDEGLITPEEFEAKRAQLIAQI